MFRKVKARDFGAGIRLVATLGLMLAFAFQNYVTQSHVHGSTGISWSVDRVLDIAGGDFGKGKPAQGDPAKCPACQAAAHGQFLTPAAAAAFISVFTISTIALAIETSRPTDTVSHNWQGRAPPHA